MGSISRYDLMVYYEKQILSFTQMLASLRNIALQ
jgi:hypothetical protein